MKAEYIDNIAGTDNRILWASGILEGEGCFSIYTRRQGSKGCAIHCEMTDQDTVLKLHEVLQVGKVSKRPPRGNRKGTWILSIQKQADVFNTLLRVMPYLGNRRLEKAKELFEYLEPIVCARN